MHQPSVTSSVCFWGAVLTVCVCVWEAPTVAMLAASPKLSVYPNTGRSMHGAEVGGGSLQTVHTHLPPKKRSFPSLSNISKAKNRIICNKWMTSQTVVEQSYIIIILHQFKWLIEPLPTWQPSLITLNITNDSSGDHWFMKGPCWSEAFGYLLSVYIYTKPKDALTICWPKDHVSEDPNRPRTKMCELQAC